MKEGINVLSLFDGMSCGQIALERAGIKVKNYYASEIDVNAMQIALKNYHNTIHVGDIKNVSSEDLPKIDLLIGGSPCQGFSFAGKGLNFNDPRSKLFFEYVRLLKETNPKYFLLENVKMKKVYQDIITQYLGVEPISINSNLVSAQNRPRLYWTNIPGIQQPENKCLLYRDIKIETEDEVFLKDFQMVKLKQRSYVRIDSYKVVGEDEKVPCLLANYGSPSPKTYHECGRHRMLNPIEYERLQTVPDNYTSGLSRHKRYKMLGNGWTVDVIAHIFKNIK